MRSFVGFVFILGACGAVAACSANHSGSSLGAGGAGEDGAAGAVAEAGGDPTTLDEEPTGSGGEGSVVSCVKQGDVVKDETWGPLAGCPDGFDVPSKVRVSGAGTVLTIQPGTKLKFGEGAALSIVKGAALSAVGTEKEPILFTGWEPRPGVWGGVLFYSSALANEVSNAIIEYAGHDDGGSGNLVVSSDGPGRVKLTSTTLRHGAKFGLTVLNGGSFSEFSGNVLTDNELGAARVDVQAVQQLKGQSNSFLDNGNENSVRVEASGDVDTDMTWPNVSPAIFRVQEGPAGSIFVKARLTIEAGAVLEFFGHGGFHVDGGSAGLSAVGTKTEPIIFRGVGGSLWSGIGFYESNWSKNALEYVQVHDAKGPYDWNLLAGKTPPSVFVSQIGDTEPSQLRIKNVAFTNSDKGVVDIVQVKPSTLVQEGTNTGTGTGGALKVLVLQ